MLQTFAVLDLFSKSKCGYVKFRSGCNYVEEKWKQAGRKDSDGQGIVENVSAAEEINARNEAFERIYQKGNGST